MGLRDSECLLPLLKERQVSLGENTHSQQEKSPKGHQDPGCCIWTWTEEGFVLIWWSYWVFELLWLCDPWNWKGAVAERLGPIEGLKLKQIHFKFFYALMPRRSQNSIWNLQPQQTKKGAAGSVWASRKTNCLTIWIDQSWCRGKVEVSRGRGKKKNKTKQKKQPKPSRQREKQIGPLSRQIPPFPESPGS